MYLPLKFADGIYANGTPYQRKARWIDSDRMRFHEGKIEMIGGWTRATDENGVLIPSIITSPATQRARAALAWQRNDGESMLVIGHNGGVYYIDHTGAVLNISPVGWTEPPAGPVSNTGYGGYFYGLEAYGTERPTSATSIQSVFNWCFRNWGETLLTQTRWPYGGLYEWDKGDANMTLVSNAPIDANCMHVTQQRIVMLGGTPTEARLIQWCDSEDYNVWTPAINNQAGNQILPGVGKILDIVTTSDVTLVVTETDAHVARYLGPPYIYGFDRVADNCGAVSAASIVATENFAVWPGRRTFYIFDGNTVTPVECSVMERLVELLNSSNAGLVTGFVLPTFNEVWWFIPDESGLDMHIYVTWDYRRNHWTMGTIDRTVGVATLPKAQPIMVDNAGYLYRHELKGVVPGDNENQVFIRSGPIEIGQGDNVALINAIIPDLVTQGQVDFYLHCADFPGATKQTFGPYTFTFPNNTGQGVPTRARGRTVEFEVRGKSSTFYMGDTRLDLKKGGQR